MIVVITGASSGIGRATALKFASKGHDVVLAARFGAGLDQVAQECENLGVKALAIPTDVSIESDVIRIANQAVQTFGKFDIWVNNAAVSLFGHFEEIPMYDIRQLIEINLFGYIYGARAAMQQFKNQGYGNLVNISSMAAVNGQPYCVPYTISKAGIRGLSLSLSQEVADQKDIHVCCVLPAVIDTPIFQHAANYMGKRINAPSPVIPAEKVAKAIYKLAKHPQEEIMVGSMARMMRAQRSIMPLRLFDKYMQKMIQRKHFKTEDSGVFQGNLYGPMTNWNRVNGGWIPDKDKMEQKVNTLTTLTTIGSLILAGFIVRKSLLNNK